MVTKHSATKDEEQFPAQIYNLPCCFNSWTLPYAPKENGPPHFRLKGKKVMQWKKSSKKEPDAEHKKMFSESKQRLATRWYSTELDELMRRQQWFSPVDKGKF